MEELRWEPLLLLLRWDRWIFMISAHRCLPGRCAPRSPARIGFQKLIQFTRVGQNRVETEFNVNSKL